MTQPVTSHTTQPSSHNPQSFTYPPLALSHHHSVFNPDTVSSPPFYLSLSLSLSLTLSLSPFSFSQNRKENLRTKLEGYTSHIIAICINKLQIMTTDELFIVKINYTYDLENALLVINCSINPENVHLSLGM